MDSAQEPLPHLLKLGEDNDRCTFVWLFFCRKEDKIPAVLFLVSSSVKTIFIATAGRSRNLFRNGTAANNGHHNNKGFAIEILANEFYHRIKSSK